MPSMSNGTERDPLHGYVPFPRSSGRQTEAQRNVEGVLLRVLTVAASPLSPLSAVLNEINTSRAQRYMKRRISTLKKEFDERMEGVKDETVDREYMRSEAFFDLVVEAVEATLRTRDELKIKMMARVLSGALLEGAQTGYSPEEYLRLFASLTPTELRVALALFEQQPEQEADGQDENGAWSAWQEHVCGEVGIDTADLRLTLSRLYSSGLLEEISSGLDKNENLYIEVLKPGEIFFYKVSTSFDKLMKFVAFPPQLET